jgi:hypothetical protein
MNTEPSIITYHCPECGAQAEFYHKSETVDYRCTLCLNVFEYSKLKAKEWVEKPTYAPLAMIKETHPTLSKQLYCTVNDDRAINVIRKIRDDIAKYTIDKTVFLTALKKEAQRHKQELEKGKDPVFDFMGFKKRFE